MNQPIIHKGVILAGGLGTRFLPWTAGASKTMLPLIDKPALGYIVDEFTQSGITKIMIIVGHSKDSIIKYFDHNLGDINDQHKNHCKSFNLDYSPITIDFAVQKKLCGTANALLQAEKFIKADDFAVACGDELFLGSPPVIAQMLKAYQQLTCAIMASRLLPKNEATRFGVLHTTPLKNRLSVLNGIIEKPPISQITTPLVNLGRYVLPNCIFDYLHDLAPNKNGEWALTDALLRMSRDTQVLCYNFKGKHYDIGNKVGYTKAFIDFALTHPQTKDEIPNYLLQKIITTLQTPQI